MGRVFDRIFLFLYSLIVGIALIFLILVATGLVEAWVARDVTDALTGKGAAAWTVAVIAILLFVISVRFFYISVAAGSGKPPSIDQRTDYGDISISLETIENLALKAASRITAIKDIKARVNVGQAGLIIKIRAVIDGETSIPMLTEDVQRAVKSHVEEISGVPVTHVNVFIANIVQTTTFRSRVE
jgi:uncharacterized alkaline shock family protein YloU